MYTEYWAGTNIIAYAHASALLRTLAHLRTGAGGRGFARSSAEIQEKFKPLYKLYPRTAWRLQSVATEVARCTG